MAKKILFETALADVHDSDIEGVGVLRETEGGNVYRYVKNLTPSAQSAGDWMAYPAADFSASSALAFTRVQLLMGTDLICDTLAGVLMGAIGTSSASCYGWIQVKGFNSAGKYLQASATTLAVGDKICPASASAAATVLVDSASAVTKMRFAIALKAVASPETGSTSSPIPVFINCL